MRISDWSSDVCSSDLFLSADEFRKRVFGDMEILGEHGIGQPSCDFGDEALVVGNALKKPLDRGFELLRLPAELHVVVQDLPFLIRGDVAKLDHHLRDRKSVVKGKSVAVRVDLGGSRIIKK